MNALESYIAEKKADPIRVMNWLQGHEFISDLCLWPKDVPEPDASAAVERLRKLYSK